MRNVDTYIAQAQVCRTKKIIAHVASNGDENCQNVNHILLNWQIAKFSNCQ